MFTTGLYRSVFVEGCSLYRCIICSICTGLLRHMFRKKFELWADSFLYSENIQFPFKFLYLFSVLDYWFTPLHHALSSEGLPVEPRSTCHTTSQLPRWSFPEMELLRCGENAGDVGKITADHYKTRGNADEDHNRWWPQQMGTTTDGDHHRWGPWQMGTTIDGDHKTGKSILISIH